MKTMKKFGALFLAIVMAMALAVPAYAANSDATHTISVNSEDTHKYDVYQILTGTISNNGDGDTLSNVSWGSSVNDQTDGKINGKTATEFAKSLENLSGVDLVAEVAKYFTTGDAKKVGQVDASTSLANQPTGYYVMVDVTNPLDENDTKALNVIKLVKDVEVTVKWGTTSDVKTIETDTLGQTGTDTNDINDDNDNVSIGDTVNYKIEAAVPDKATEFKPGTFFFVITDKLSSGLTFTDGSIKVYVGNSTTPLDTDKYTVKTTDIGENTFEIGLVNAAQYAGQTITVKYSAVLNENAVIGDAGNPNTSTVKFSNDPNKTYDGSPEDQNNPGFPDSTKDVPTGETPESETLTYTTGIEILKVDENGEPIKANVKFKLEGTSAKTVVTKTTSFEEATAENGGKYYLLKDGTYTMTKPTEGNTMVPAEAGATKGYVVDAEASGDGVITIGETKYRPYVPETDKEKALFVLDEGSKDAYASTTTLYKKTVTEKDVIEAGENVVYEASVDSNGIVRFDGLGAGKYKLTETQWPDGYNTAEPVEVTITYNPDGTAKFTVDNGKYEDGVVKLEVVNKKGGTMPETGGIGTKIFYTMGAVLVIGAGVVLVSRKRAAE